MTDIAANIARIREQIETACLRVRRDPQRVRLVAVSKVKPAKDVEAAFMAGQKLFGESYVQEFRDKEQQVREPVSWHFIGGLQSNKVKYLRGKVDMIHSVDRLSLAKEINHQWEKVERCANILIQVNIGDEESKSGCQIDELELLVRAIAELPNLKICGLMCLPPDLDDAEQVRPYFRELRQLAEKIAALKIPGVSMDELSMGMSGDFEVAVEEGATLVRIGTAIFGARVRANG
ncbi:MAG: YggS family pyridoxal phosphate-dependent enzyme [Desulfuromonas sp.]|nr:MAG: YggS family pyridoxal phosphate-dependent enzyme [Desulfuromonas sp.]